MLTTADRLIDSKLDEELRAGTIRLVRAAWLLSDACPAVMPRCQALPQAAFASPSDASALLRRGDRSVLALSHGWLSAAHPDPQGETLRALKRHLRSATPDAAVFVECAWRGRTRAARPRSLAE